MYVPKQRRIAQENHAAHVALLEAYRREDLNGVYSVMTRHMQECTSHIADLEAFVKARFLTDETATVSLERKK
jgi:DNA-binding GntR family transcriptional regulator